MINAQAKDPGLQKYQDIFRRHPERIFQWAENRSVPAENNMSERGVRRTVIARKVCGGSQSKDALMVREVLQSVIESLRLRCADPVAKLTEALDAYAIDPGICIPDLLFPLPTHKAELSRRRAGTRRVLKKAGRSRICLSVDGKHLKVDCGFGLDDSKSSDALLLKCSNAEVGEDRASGVDRPSTLP